MVRKLFKLFTSKEMIAYAIAGVLTTLVNFLTSHILYDILGVDENITNAVAWLTAVIFAFFANDIFVFTGDDEKKSNEKGDFIDAVKNRKKSDAKPQRVIRFFKFTAGRVFTLIVELGATYLFVTRLLVAYWPVKIITSVVVIILNYVISKYLVFNRSGKSGKNGND